MSDSEKYGNHICNVSLINTKKNIKEIKYFNPIFIY